MRALAVVPEFEIYWKTEIMRMISFFLPDLRLSAAGTPELRIAAPAALSKYPGCFNDFPVIPGRDLPGPWLYLGVVWPLSTQALGEASSLVGGRPSPTRNNVSDLRNMFVMFGIPRFMYL